MATDAKISQEAQLVLNQTNPDARSSQDALLVLNRPTPDARASQIAVLVLTLNVTEVTGSAAIASSQAFNAGVGVGGHSAISGAFAGPGLAQDERGQLLDVAVEFLSAEKIAIEAKSEQRKISIEVKDGNS